VDGDGTGFEVFFENLIIFRVHTKNQKFFESFLAKNVEVSGL